MATADMAKQEPESWRHSINYGPDGEQNYAMVYDGCGTLVGNLKTHHAIAVCNAMELSARLATGLTRPAPDLAVKVVGSKPLTAADLSEALGAFWNAALGEAQRQQDGFPFASIMAEGFSAVAHSLAALDTAPQPAATDAEIARLREALQRIVNLDEADGHNLTWEHASQAVGIAADALKENTDGE